MEVARKSAGTAFFLSLIPGVGHLYAGRTGAGILWLVVVVFMYGVLPGLGFVLHMVCAVAAAAAAAAANRTEEAELAARRESAADVAHMLDDAVRRSGGEPHGAGGAAAGAAAATDPAPRLLRGAFPVPAEALLAALAGAMRDQGLLVLGVDQRHGRLRASMDHGGGRFTVVAAQVEPTPSGSRVRLFIDRPEGSVPGPEPDDAALRAILERTERLLGQGGGAPGAPAPRRAGEALTEDHFLEQLREAWESFEQGWLPEPEWLRRKEGLIRGVTLRKGTRKSDFMTACRPLVEAGVLGPEDLRALETSIPG
jgi:hypothetical protein